MIALIPMELHPLLYTPLICTHTLQMFKCVVVEKVRKATFRKIYQCLAYNRMKDDVIYEKNES